MRAPLLAFALLATLAALAIVLVAPAGAGAAQCRGGDAPPAKLNNERASKAVLCLLNKKRRSQGMNSLDRKHNQVKAAKRHNRLMLRKRCFSHQCPGERDLSGRLKQADYLPCNCSWGVAENIAYGEGRRGSPRGIVHAWMRSPDHRMNILNPSYEHIGVAAISGTPAGGARRGSLTYTTDFGYKR